MSRVEAVSQPRHIAIIMDGNGRWAERRNRARVHGHIRGARRVKGIVREASRLGVEALTLFAFSTENWLRPESERLVLWALLKKYLEREREELKRENVRLRVIGEIHRLSADVQRVLTETTRYLEGCTGLNLTFAISYGSRREMVVAAQAFAQDCLRGKASPDALTEEDFESYLWTQDLGDLSDVDLLIRTGGEMRVSNFLSWQAAYAEYYFTETCWPDFLPEELAGAVEDFSRRERRYGQVLTPRDPQTLRASGLRA